ncbi:MAG: hypothetical protein IMX04_06580 [Candidatus Carbobacillus altaicus]|uniref:Uncharacterized protein n=1 Tax=Candidatus Carbonibacillus altaicus TaxID=2163959 RepID=A0A2R6Y3G9_9BACL|nr:hypothetical protein [Candidatus Carbobacillus altaicus]PTQ57221.1 MAG: hypothetical protein BSOLF_1986 [Candidatus Carbobacillus altaicus]
MGRNDNDWGAFFLGAGLGLLTGALIREMGGDKLVRQGQNMVEQAGRWVGQQANNMTEMAEELLPKTNNAVKKDSVTRSNKSQNAKQDGGFVEEALNNMQK